MNPLTSATQLTTRLTDYIRFSLPIERSVPEFTPHIEKLFAEHEFAKAPYLELMTGYKTGESLRELARDGVIHRLTASIFAKAFLGEDTPEKFFLYTHQANAIRAVCGQGKNLIVCSGTGSGKTETFLIPLVDYLVRQHEDGNLKEGVRAMLLYPMNALVNDQIRRLRQVLKEAPFIILGNTSVSWNTSRTSKKASKTASAIIKMALKRLPVTTHGRGLDSMTRPRCRMSAPPGPPGGKARHTFLSQTTPCLNAC